MPCYAQIDHMAVLLFEGADARKFLHGQCTQDVLGRDPGQGGHAFVLDPRGKNLGDLIFVVRDHDVFALADAARAVAMRTWLERFIISADVRISDVTPEWCGLTLAGEGAAAAVKALCACDPPVVEHAAAAGTFGSAGFMVIADHTFGPEGFMLWTHGVDAAATLGSIAAALARHGSSAAPPDALTALRIAAFRPRFGVDLDESTLPMESGQESRAVSYTKGCYSGQEVVAKQKYLGKPRKMLTAVRPERVVGTPARLALEGSDDDAGTLTSCAALPGGETVGLAMLKAPLPGAGSILVAPGGVRVNVTSA